MLEVIEKYVGKQCLIHTMSSQIEGTVVSVKDNWIEVMGKNGAVEAVNADFVMRVREYPRNKNGKKKSVVID